MRKRSMATAACLLATIMGPLIVAAPAARALDLAPLADGEGVGETVSMSSVTVSSVTDPATLVTADVSMYQPPNEAPSFAYTPTAANPISTLDITSGGGVSPNSAVSGESFAGAGNAGYSPADPDIGAGPTYLLSTVNGRYQIEDKTGAITSKHSLAGLFSVIGASGKSTVDPSSAYDRISGRYYITFLGYTPGSNDFRIYVGISNGTNPNGTWCVGKFNPNYRVSGNTNYLPDQPRLGYDGANLYITANMDPLDSSPYGGVELWVLPKSSWLNTSCGSVTANYIYGFHNPDGSKALAMLPARQVASAGTEYFVASFGSSPHTAVSVWTCPPSACTKSNLGRTAVGMSAYTNPPRGIEPGTARINTGDARVDSVSYWNNELWFTNNVGSTISAGQPAVLISRIAAATMSAYSVQIYGTGLSVYYGAVAVNTNDHQAAVVSYSSATQYPSTAFVQASSGAWTAGSTVMKAGSGSVTSGYFGDFAGAAPDPDGSRIWLHAEYGTSGTKDYSTWITAVH